MGAQVSVQNQITETVSNVTNKCLIEMSSQCVTTASQLQSIEASAGGNLTVSDVSQTQQNVVNLDCLQSSKNDTAFQNAIASQLATSLKNDQSGVPIGVSVSTQDNTTINTTNIANTIKIDDIKSCMAASSLIQNQKYTATGNVTLYKLSQSQMSNVLTSCVQNSLATQNAIADVSTKISAASESKQQGFNLALGSGISGIVSILCIIVLAISALSGLKTAGQQASELAIKLPLNSATSVS